MTELVKGEPLLARGYKSWLLAVLLAVSIFNFADRAILSVLAEPIKLDLKLTDTQLGMLQGLGFAILYSVLGVPIGWLTERVSRKGVIAACVAVWSLMTVACGFATNFATLLIGRVGVGIGEAGFQPASNSLLADHFKASQRASVISVILLGAPFGFLVGQGVGGWIASVWGWRVAFYALGVPGLLSALIVWLTLREPPRGLAEGHIITGPAPTITAVVRHLWAMPTFRHLLIGMAVAQFAVNAIAVFVLPFYLRSFGLPLAVAGAAFGMVAFSSNGLGTVLGGLGFDALSKRDLRWALWGPAAVVTLAAPIYFFAFGHSQVWISMGLVWLANFVLATFYAPTMATVQNLVGPRMRASTSALVGVVLGLVGAGLGPTVLGVASDAFAVHAFTLGDFLASCPGGRAAPGAGAALETACRTASALGLRYALMAAPIFFVWAAVHYVLAARTLKADFYRPDDAGTP